MFQVATKMKLFRHESHVKVETPAPQVIIHILRLNATKLKTTKPVLFAAKIPLKLNRALVDSHRK